MEPEQESLLRHYKYENGNIKVEGFSLNPEEYQNLQLKALKLTLIRECREKVRNKLKDAIQNLRLKEEQYSSHYCMKMGKKFTPHFNEHYLKPINKVIDDAQSLIEKFDAHNDSESVTEVWYDGFYELVDNLKFSLRAVRYQTDLLYQPYYCSRRADAAGAVSDA